MRRFAIEGERFVLWRRLGLEVPELIHRSPAELRAKWLAMQAENEKKAVTDSWEDLPCLEDWKSTGAGRFHGELHGLEGVRDGSLSVTVQQDENAIADGVVDVYAEQWCVRTRTGEYFQLGRQNLADDQALSTFVEPIRVPDIEQLPAVAGVAASTAGQLVVPPLLMGGVLVAASAIGYMVLGHHHVDVSVFIV